VNAFLDDGSAVAACRALLQDKGIPGSWNWRNTVVTRDVPEYMVRDLGQRSARPGPS
jgi:hypothetical protein